VHRKLRLTSPAPSLADRRHIALITEAVRTSETSVYLNKNAGRYIPEGYNSQCNIFSIIREISPDRGNKHL
jgi:hypothetical protein